MTFVLLLGRVDDRPHFVFPLILGLCNRCDTTQSLSNSPYHPFLNFVYAFCRSALLTLPFHTFEVIKRTIECFLGCRMFQ